MMRNIPDHYMRDSLSELLDDNGFAEQYELIYVPMNFRNECGFGYAFICMESPEVAEEFMEVFEGFQGWSEASPKVCSVTWSDTNQTLEEHIEAFRNSPVMHETVPDKYKPALYKGGERLPFPAPTTSIKPPRVRKTPTKGEDGTTGDEPQEAEGSAAIQDQPQMPIDPS